MDVRCSGGRGCLCLLLAHRTVLHAEGKSSAKPQTSRSSKQRVSDRSKSSSQEETRFRSPFIPRNHWRGQEIFAFPEETRNLCARGCSRCGVLSSDRQGKTHRGFKNW